MRFVIRERGGGLGEPLRARLRASPRVSVLDETPTMLLVEADSESDLRAEADLSGLLVVPERHYDPPGTT